MPGIKHSVGANGRNHKADVKVVQALLNKWREDIGLSRTLDVDGAAGDKTVKAIVDFQARVMGMIEPDGRVDPRGRTLAALNARALNLTLLPKSGTGGYYVYTSEKKRHGTSRTLASVRRAAQAMAELGLEIGVGNISLKNGGKMAPHKSHQRGVDVDFRPLRKDGKRLAVTCKQAAYSSADTAKLVGILRNDESLQMILFNDSKIAGTREWPGHDNHLHVRFKA